MKALVSPDIFPAAQQYTYLNAASVALMPKMAAEATLDWQTDLALRGTVHFDEEAEAGYCFVLLKTLPTLGSVG